LERYHLEAISIKNNDELLAKMFPLSLKVESFLWSTNLPNERIICFDDVVKAFLDQYILFIT